MNKVTNFLIKKSSFIFYKRTLALVLAFVMLFNLTSDIFASTLQAKASIEKMQEISAEIKETLSKEKDKKEISSEGTACSDVKSCYEKALLAYIKAAQDYSDFTYAVVSFLYSCKYNVSGKNYLNTKYKELNKKIEDYNNNVKQFNSDVSETNDLFGDYLTYKLLEASMEERNANEQEALARLANSKDKDSQEMYNQIKANNEKTQAFLNNAEKWQQYEEEVERLRFEKQNIDNREQVLTDEQTNLETEKKGNDEERAFIYNYHNEEMTKIFGDQGDIYKVDSKTDLDEYLDLVSKKTDQLYAVYKAKEEAHKAAYDKYLEVALKEYKAKIERFTENLKERCSAEQGEYDLRVKGFSTFNKPWHILNQEKRLYETCIAPVVSLSDFTNLPSNALTYDEFVELKYNEWYEEYVPQKYTKGWVKKTEDSRTYWTWHPDIDALAKEKAAKVMGLMLLSGTLGMQALITMIQESKQADSLRQARNEMIDIVEDVEPDEIEPYFRSEADRKAYEESKKYTELAQDYLDNIDKEQQKKYNIIFNIVKRVNDKAKEELGKMYGPVMVKIAAGENPESVLRSIGLNPQYVKDVAQKLLASMDKDTATLVREEIAASGKTYSKEYIDTLITAQEESAKKNRSTKEKVLDGVALGLDILFIWWPTTIPSMINDKNARQKQHNNAVQAYRIETSDVIKNLLKGYALYFGAGNIEYWNQVAKIAERNKADGVLAYMRALANSMGLNGNGTEIREKHRIQVAASQNNRKVEDFDIIGPLLIAVDLVLIIATFAFEMPSLIARFASVSRNLRFLSVDQRIMKIALNNIVRRMNPATFNKYKKSLEIMRKFEKIPLTKGKDLQAYLQASKNISKVDKQVFKESLELAKKGNAFGKQTKNYQKAVRTFEDLLKDQKQVSSYLHELTQASKQGSTVLTELNNQSKIVAEIMELANNPALKEYNEALRAYNNSFRVSVVGETSAASAATEVGNVQSKVAVRVEQVEKVKAPKKTKEVAALEKRIKQLSSKVGNLTPQANRFLNIQEKAAKSSSRISKYFEKYEKANKLATEGKPRKVKGTKTKRAKVNPNEVHSYNAPKESEAIADLNNSVRAANETKSAVQPRKFTFMQDLKIRFALSEPWNLIKEGFLGLGQIFVKKPSYVLGGIMPATAIGVEAPLLTSQSVIEVMRTTEAVRTLPMSLESFKMASPITVNGLKTVKTSPVVLKGVNASVINNAAGNTGSIFSTGILSDFNGFEGYDKRWYSINLSRKKQHGVSNLNALWWNKATTAAYYKDMQTLQEKIIAKYQQEALELISKGEPLPAGANITMQKVYKDVNSQVNTNMLWWVYGDEVEDVLSNFKRHIPASTGRVAAVSLLPLPIPEELMGYLTGRAAVGLSYKELDVVKKAVMDAFKATGEKYIAEFEGAQMRINQATAMLDDNFVNILKTNIAENISQLDINKIYTADIIKQLSNRIDKMKNGEAIAVRRAVYNSTKEAMNAYVAKYGQQALNLIEQDANLKDPKFVELFMNSLQQNLAKTSLAENRQADYFKTFAQRLGFVADEKSKWRITRDVAKVMETSAVYGASIDGRMYAGSVTLINHRGLVLGLMRSPVIDSHKGRKINLLRDGKVVSSGKVVNYSEETGISVILIEKPEGLATYTLAKEYPLPNQVLYINGNSYAKGNSYVAVRKFDRLDVKQDGYMKLQGITSEDHVGAGLIDENGNLYGLVLQDNAIGFNNIKPLLTQTVSNIFNNTQFREQAVKLYPEFANSYKNILANIDKEYQVRRYVFEKDIDIFGHHPNVESVFGPYKIRTVHLAAAPQNTLKITPDLQQHMHVEMDLLTAQVLRTEAPIKTTLMKQTSGAEQSVFQIFKQKIKSLYSKIFAKKGSNRLYMSVFPLTTVFAKEITSLVESLIAKTPAIKAAFKKAENSTLSAIEEQSLSQQEAEDLFLKNLEKELLAANITLERTQELVQQSKIYLQILEVNTDNLSAEDTQDPFDEINTDTLASYDQSLLAFADDLRVYYDSERQQWNYGINQRMEQESRYVETEPNYYALGLDSFEKNKYQEAVDYFDKSIENQGASGEVYASKAHAKFYLEKYEEALKDIEKAISLLGRLANSNLYYFRGLIKGRLGNYKDASLDFDKAIELLDPNNDFYSVYKQIYLSTKTEAQSKLLEASYPLKYNKEDLIFSDDLRVFYDTEKQEWDYGVNQRMGKATQQTNDAPNYYAMGKESFEKKNYQEAVDFLDKAIAENPNLVSAYIARSHAKFYLGNYTESLADIEQAMKRLGANVNSNIYYSRGVLNERLGNYHEAILDFERAIEHLDYNNEYYSVYEQIYSSAKEEAQKSLQEKASLAEGKEEISQTEKETSSFKKLMENVKAKLFSNKSDNKLYMSLLVLSTAAVLKIVSFSKDLINRTPAIKKAFKNAQEKTIEEMNSKNLSEQEGQLIFLNNFEEGLRAAEFEDEKIKELLNTTRYYMGVQENTQTVGEVAKPANNLLPSEVKNPTAENYLKKAREAEKQKIFEDAFNYYTKAIELDPKNPQYRYERGMFQSSFLRDKAAGLQDLNEAVRLASNDGKYYFYRAQFKSLDENGAAEALKDYNKAIECDSSNYEYYEARAHLKYWNFDREDALKDMKTAFNLLSQKSGTGDMNLFRLSYTVNYWTKDIIGNEEKKAATFKKDIKTVYNKVFSKKRHGKLFMSFLPLTTSFVMKVIDVVQDVNDGIPAMKRAFKNAEERTLSSIATADNKQAKDLFLGYLEEELAFAKVDPVKAENLLKVTNTNLQDILLETPQVATPKEVPAAAATTLTAREKKNITPYDQMTDMEMIASDPKGMIEELTQLIDLIPSDDVAYFYRAQAKAELKDYYGAIGDLEKAIFYNGGNAEYHYTISWLKRHVQNYAGAEESLTKAIALNADKAICFYDRAVLRHYYTNNLEGAVADYKDAIALKQAAQPDEVSRNQLYELSLQEAEELLEEQKANGGAATRIQDMVINNFLESFYAQIPATVTPEQEEALNALRNKAEKLREEAVISKVIDNITLYKEALSLILMDKPVLSINGAQIKDEIEGKALDGYVQADNKNVVNVSVNSDMRTNADLYRLLPEFKDRLAFYISNLSNSHKEFSVIINMHGSIKGAILMDEKTDLSAVLRTIKDNAAASKVNIISNACHGQAGDAAFIQKVIDYGFNYLGITAKNDVFVVLDIKNIFNYDLPTAFINSIMLGYYGAILVYNGKVYRALDIIKEHYKNNPEKLKEIELLQEYYFGDNPVQAMLDLGKLDNYDLQLFNSKAYSEVSNAQAAQLSVKEIENIVLNEKPDNFVVGRTIHLGYPFAMKVGKHILTLSDPSLKTKAAIIRAAKEALQEDEVQVVNEDLVTKPGNYKYESVVNIDKPIINKFLGIENIVTALMQFTLAMKEVNPHAPKYTELWASFATMTPDEALKALSTIKKDKLLVKDKYGKLPVEYALQNKHKVGISPQNNVFAYVYMYSVQAGLNINNIVDEEKGMTLAMLTLKLEDNHSPFSFLQSEVDLTKVDKEGNSLLKYIIEGADPLETLKFLLLDQSKEGLAKLINMQNNAGEGALQYIDRANLSPEDKLKLLKFLREKGLQFDTSDTKLVSSLQTRELRDYSVEALKQTKAAQEHTAYVNKAEQEFLNPTEGQAVLSKDGKKVSMSVLSYVDEKLAADFINRVQDINEVNGDGFTALMYAAKNPNVKVVNLVLKNGGRANIQTKAGRALLIAQAANNADVIKILEKKDKIFKQEQKALKDNTQEILDFDSDKTAFAGQKNLLPKKSDLKGLYVSLESSGDLITPLEKAENLRYLPTDSEVKVKEEKILGMIYDDILKNPFKADSHKVMAVLQGNGSRLFILNHGIAPKDATTGKLAEDIHPDIRRHYGLVRIIHNHLPGVKPIFKRDVTLLPTIVRSNPFFEDDKFIVFHTPQQDGSVLVTIFAKVNADEAIIVSMRKISKEEAAKDSAASEEINSLSKGENNDNTEEIQAEEEQQQTPAPKVESSARTVSASQLAEIQSLAGDPTLKGYLENFVEVAKTYVRDSAKIAPLADAKTNKDKAYFNEEDFFGKKAFEGEYSVENPQDYTILVVNDEDKYTRPARASLAAKGFNVYTAKDGDEALAILKHLEETGTPVHFVLLDSFIPGKNGYEVAVAINSTNKALKTDTVVISFSSGTRNAENRYKRGFDFSFSTATNSMDQVGNYISYLIQKYGFQGGQTIEKKVREVFTFDANAEVKDVQLQNIKDYGISVVSDNPAHKEALKALRSQGFIAMEYLYPRVDDILYKFGTGKRQLNIVLADKNDTEIDSQRNKDVCEEKNILVVKIDYKTADLSKLGAYISGLIQEKGVAGTPFTGNTNWISFDNDDIRSNFNTKFEGEYTVDNPQDYNVLVAFKEEEKVNDVSTVLKGKGFNVITANSASQVSDLLSEYAKEGKTIHFAFLGDLHSFSLSNYGIAEQIKDEGLNTIVFGVKESGFVPGDFELKLTDKDKFGNFLSYIIQKYSLKGTPKKPSGSSLGAIGTYYIDQNPTQNLATPIELSQANEQANFTTEIKEDQNPLLFLDTPTDTPASLATFFAFLPFVIFRRIKPTSAKPAKANKKTKSPTHLPLYYAEDIQSSQLIPLNFTFQVDPGLKVNPKYDKVIFDKKGVAYYSGEDGTKVISNWYMQVPSKPYDLKILIRAIRSVRLATPFEIKFTFPNFDNTEFQRVLLYNSYHNVMNINALFPVGFLKENEGVMYSNGTFYTFDKKSLNKLREIKDFSLRVPKHQISNLTEIFNNSKIKPNITLVPNFNKASVVYRDAMLSNISVGKTFGAIVKKELHVSGVVANGVLFGIQYIIPLLSVFIKPIVNKLGEKKTLILALSLSIAAGVMACAAGFYGVVPTTERTTIQKGIFLLAFVFMSLSTLLRQLVSTILIGDNTGTIKDTDPKASKYVEISTDNENNSTENASFKRGEETFGEYIKRMNKQIFGAPKDIYSVPVELVLSKAFVFKSIGTLAFLSLPYIINKVVSWVTLGNVWLNLDYSASFPLLAAFSIYAAIRTLNTSLRDRTATLSKQERKDAKNERKKTRKEKKSKFKENAKEYGFFNVINKITKDKIADLKAKAELKKQAAKKNFSSQNLSKLYKENSKILRYFTALAFANAHEIVISSALAAQLSLVFKNSATSNFYTALGLYAPLLLGRWLFSIVRGKTSRPSSAVAFMGLSVLGTLIMLLNPTSTPLLITGAAIASLGMGNCFTLLYTHIISQYSKEKEISISTAGSLSVVPGAILAMLSPYLIEQGHFQASMLYAFALIAAVVFFSLPAMEGAKLLSKVKQALGFEDNTSKENAAPKTEKKKPFEDIGKWWHYPKNGPDMNNPTPQN